MNERRKLDNTIPYRPILVIPDLGITIDLEVDAHGIPIIPEKGDDVFVDGTWYKVTQREWNFDTKLVTVKAR